uniref:Uncharacterized protein n=1 Tax=Lygus hesperus TaxID=30085 RepID=A0A146KWG1_LYGHE
MFDFVTKSESKQSQDGSSGSSACTVVDVCVAEAKSMTEAKYAEKRTEQFTSVQSKEFVSLETHQTMTQESHVQEVVGVVSKITQKIDRLENTIDDLVKRLSRTTESSSRSSNVTVSDFETSEMSEKSVSESKTLTEGSTGVRTSTRPTLDHQVSMKPEKERVVMTKDDFVEKVKTIGSQLRSRLQPDRYIRRVSQQCERYVHELEVMDVAAGPKKKPRSSVSATARAAQGTRE